MATQNIHPTSSADHAFVTPYASSSTLPSFSIPAHLMQPPPFNYQHESTGIMTKKSSELNTNKKRKKEKSLNDSKKKKITTVSSPNASGKRKMTPMSAFRDENSSSNSSSNLAAANSSKSKAHSEKFKRNSRACTYCQRLKMKCSGPTADGPCERCRRTGRECMVQERAPRRPWTKKKDMQIQQLTDRLEEMEGLLRNAFDKNVNPNDAAAAMAAAAATIADGGDVQTASQRFAAGVQASQDVNNNNNQNYGKASTNNLANEFPQSPALKRLNGNNGMITSSPGAITNWLNLTNAPSTPSAINELDLAYVDSHREQLPFVCTGKITPSEAVELFHQCMNSCVLHTVILDPEWHTIPRVGDASPFLFGVVVLIGSTYHRERRKLRQELQEEMNILIGQAITTGPKSIEVVQAFLLLYQWNTPSTDPEDDRAWLLAGIGIRMATEMQLYKPQPRTINGTKKNAYIETDRERINRERCWLMTFLVDRSLSIAVGRSWSISEKAELVRESDKWSKQSASRPWDQGISAFADLLKTTSRQADVLHTAMASEGDQTSFFDCDTMMRIMNDELEHWRSRWLSRDFYAMTAELDKDAAERAVTRRHVNSSTSGSVHNNNNENSMSSMSVGNLDKWSPTSSVSVNTDALDVHLRTLYYITKQASLRYNFAVLVLNSFGLQYCSTHPNLNHARNFCLTHALRACQGLLKAARDGMGNTMAFAPQTQYTILSFGIISLIKLSSLVDETVEERLIKEVNSCIEFLESVAISSDHIAARLASLLRAMLRRRESIKEHRLEKETEKGEKDEEDANFAPGMEVHKLPQRSSRAVTPVESTVAFGGGAEGLIGGDVFGTGWNGDDLMSGFDVESTLQSLGMAWMGGSDMLAGMSM